MIDKATFAKGMADLEIAFPTNVSEEEKGFRLKTYYNAIGPEMDVDDWAHAIADTLKTFAPPPMFPPIERLLRHVNARKKLTLTEEAVLTFQRVVDGYIVNPGRGIYWTREHVAEHVSKEAAHAFVCAGGDGAFQGLAKHEPFVRKAFVDAYVERKRAIPAALPSVERRELPQGESHGMQRGKSK